MNNGISDNKNDDVIARIAAYINAQFHAATSPVLIAVSGPGGCGKSAFCKKLNTMLPSTSILSLDNYRIPREERRPQNLFGSHPDANRINLLLEHLDQLHLGNTIYIPLYDTVTGTVTQDSFFTPEHIVLLDGEIAAYSPIATRCDFSIHLDADREILFARRVKRDVEQYGYTIEKVKAVFEQSMHDYEIYGTYGKEHANIRLVSDDAFRLEISCIHGDLSL
jgi:phosphoribulokinase